MLQLLFIVGFFSSAFADSVDDIHCTDAGYFPNPTDCTKFYVCIDWFGNGKRISVFHFDCPYGTVYDPTLFICNHPEWIKPPPVCAGGHLVVPGPVNVLPDPVDFSGPSEVESVANVVPEAGPEPAPNQEQSIVVESGTEEKEGIDQSNAGGTDSGEIIAWVVSSGANTSSESPGSESSENGDTISEGGVEGEANKGNQPVESEAITVQTSQEQSPAKPAENPAATGTDVQETSSSDKVTTAPAEGSEESNPGSEPAKEEVTAASAEGSEESGPSSETSSESEEGGIIAWVVAPGQPSESEASKEPAASENPVTVAPEQPEASPVQPEVSAVSEVSTSSPGSAVEPASQPSSVQPEVSAETSTGSPAVKPEEGSVTVKPGETSAAVEPEPADAVKFPETTNPKPTQPPVVPTASSKPNNSSAVTFGPGELNFQLNCGTKDFLRLPTACDRFYKCYWITSESRLGIDLFQCDRGLLFDDLRKRCDKAENVDCPLKQSTSYTVAPGSLFNCPEPGHFPFESDCIRFYRCIEVKPRELKGLLYRCPVNYGFSEVTRRCEKQASLGPCERPLPKSNTPLHNIDLEETTILQEKDLERFFRTKGFFVP